MKNSESQFKNTDQYISMFPKNVQDVLRKLRLAIRESAPQAEETISYRMPAFKQNGILVWFGVFKDHIGFFPKASGVEAFKDRLAGYRISKGTIRFPLNEPIPLDLVKEIVKYRVKENQSQKR